MLRRRELSYHRLAMLLHTVLEKLSQYSTTASLGFERALRGYCVVHRSRVLALRPLSDAARRTDGDVDTVYVPLIHK